MRAVKESCERVNGKEVYLIHEPMAAAIGIGIDIMQPKGNMIVDIGGGTTNCCNSTRRIVCDKSVKLQVMYSQMTSFITCIRNTTYLLEKVLPKNKNKLSCNRRPRNSSRRYVSSRKRSTTGKPEASRCFLS
jgi:hypothetical protein